MGQPSDGGHKQALTYRHIQTHTDTDTETYRHRHRHIQTHTDTYRHVQTCTHKGCRGFRIYLSLTAPKQMILTAAPTWSSRSSSSTASPFWRTLVLGARRTHPDSPTRSPCKKKMRKKKKKTKQYKKEEEEENKKRRKKQRTAVCGVSVAPM